MCHYVYNKLMNDMRIKIIASTPKTLRAFKLVTLISILIAVTDLGSLFFIRPGPPDWPAGVLIRSLFIVAAGILITWGRKYFVVGSSEYRSMLLLGFGYIALGLSKLTTIGPSLIPIHIVADCVAGSLFVLAFVQTIKGRKR